MNRITLYGRLTRQPETLIGANGKPVCRFSISVRRKYRRKGEEYLEIPDGIEEELPFASPYGGYPGEVV